MRINNNVSELVGGTPLLRLNNVERLVGSEACILAKLECFNPAGSAKDRPALAMIRCAEEKGLLREVKIKEDIPRRELMIVYLRGIQLSAAAKEFIMIVTDKKNIE